MSHLTAPRAALVAAVLAVLAPIVATNALIAFYLTCVALAGVMGATFLAYLGVVDRPCARSVLDLVVCAGAMLLIMLDVAVRFPTVLDGTAPAIAGSLALLALLVALVGTVAALVIDLDTDDVRGHLRALRSPLAR
jgi:hypothetical protein